MPSPAQPAEYLTSFFNDKFMTPILKLNLHGFACRMCWDCPTPSPISGHAGQAVLAWLALSAAVAAYMTAFRMLSSVLRHYSRKYGLPSDYWVNE